MAGAQVERPYNNDLIMRIFFSPHKMGKATMTTMWTRTSQAVVVVANSGCISRLTNGDLYLFLYSVARLTAVDFSGAGALKKLAYCSPPCNTRVLFMDPVFDYAPGLECRVRGKRKPNLVSLPAIVSRTHGREKKLHVLYA
ncbi:hypothetical protein MUK42_27549 [Musa troglodytarum]|uniref:Uncharacterized protein n=1 Tax=Musa troglodytarum TaxID=320322 RepID=A0A9E7G857_9LILI|nr:hypothetical protein MUK42_27549 [Musa troglodytarum]